MDFDNTSRESILLINNEKWDFLTKSKSKWTTHVSGYITSIEASILPLPSEIEISQIITGSEFYKFLSDNLAVELGPSVAKIHEIKILSKNIFFASIINDFSEADNSGMPFTKAILDCCAQLLHMDSYIKNNNYKYMVSEMSEIKVIKSNEMPLKIKCRLELKSTKKDMLVGKVTLYDKKNKVHGVINGLTMKRVKADLQKTTRIINDINISNKNEFSKYIMRTLSEILGFNKGDEVEKNDLLIHYGLDSISAMQLKMYLDPFLGTEQETQDILNNQTIDGLVNLFTIEDKKVTMEIGKSLWVKNHIISSETKFIVYALPYGGAGASIFNKLIDVQQDKAIHISPIQLPGREERFAEQCIMDIIQASSLLADVIIKHATRPFIIYGHSYGALIAAATMQKLEN